MLEKLIAQIMAGYEISKAEAKTLICLLSTSDDGDE